MGRSDPLTSKRMGAVEFSRRRRRRATELETLTSLRFEGTNGSDRGTLSGCHRGAPKRDMAPVDPLLDVHAAWVVSLSPGSAGRDALLVETHRFQHISPGQRWLTIFIAAERLIVLELLVIVPTFHAGPVGAIRNACRVPFLAFTRDGTAVLDRRGSSIKPRLV